jgi:hypothetical protein
MIWRTRFVEGAAANGYMLGDLCKTSLIVIPALVTVRLFAEMTRLLVLSGETSLIANYRHLSLLAPVLTRNRRT